MKHEFSRLFEKNTYTILHENPLSGSRVVPCGQTDGRYEALVAFRHFANTPKKHEAMISCKVVIFFPFQTIAVLNSFQRFSHLINGIPSNSLVLPTPRKAFFAASWRTPNRVDGWFVFSRHAVTRTCRTECRRSTGRQNPDSCVHQIPAAYMSGAVWNSKSASWGQTLH